MPATMALATPWRVFQSMTLLKRKRNRLAVARSLLAERAFVVITDPKAIANARADLSGAEGIVDFAIRHRKKAEIDAGDQSHRIHRRLLDDRQFAGVVGR